MTVSFLPRSSLCNHVGHVISLCAQEQVIRPDTDRNVALVQDEQAIRDLPVMKHPRDAMGHDESRSASTRDEGAVARLSYGACPEPTPPSFLDGTPETIRQRHTTLGRLACVGTEPDPRALASLDERPMAYLARPHQGWHAVTKGLASSTAEGACSVRALTPGEAFRALGACVGEGHVSQYNTGGG